MAKLLKLRRGTTTQHGSFTGAEGEVTIDTTKDTAVVHCGSVAGGHPLAKENLANVSSSTIAGRLDNDSIAPAKIGAGTLPSDVTVASANLVDGTIVNADINASAAIANSKLADSGVSAGTVGSSTAIPIVTVNSKGIVTATSTTAVDSTTIQNGSASVAVSNNGPITSNANHDFSAGIDVTGVITGDKLVLEDDGSASPILNVKTDDNSPWGIRLGNDTYSTNDNYGMMAYLSNQGEGNFHIRGDGAYKDMHFTQSDGSTNKIVIKMEADDQSAELYQGGSKRFETDSSGVTVTGNIAVSGTVDGRDVASDGSKLDGIATGATNVTNNNQLTNGAGYITASSNINASNLSSGTIPDARFPSTLPAVDGSNLTGLAAFPSGTKMIFNQASAPTGWTKVTNNVDNRALRVVSGSGGGTGGSVGFTTAFGSKSISATASSENTGGTVSGHTLTESEIPSHRHVSFKTWYHQSSPNLGYGAGWQNFTYFARSFASATNTYYTENTGGGNSHTHGFTGGAHNHSISVGNLDLAVSYIDVIVASKD
jgi:hypothetical protein